MTDKEYAASVQDEALALLKKLLEYPAPSHKEKARAEWIKGWIHSQGGVAFLDKADNVVWPLRDDGRSDILLLAAHTDTVFPDTEPMPLSEDEEILYSPGVTDDTGNLVALLLAARRLMEEGLPKDLNVIVAANSCEEGLGNLKGVKELFSTYGDRIKAFVTVDGQKFERVVTGAVGSRRYRLAVKTEGGHSFGAFGNRNAIHQASRIITALYGQKVPVEEGEKTTYNVGTIEGGTSVNTIAEECSFLYEFRSSSRKAMEQMEESLASILETFRKEGLDLTSETIGDRPAGRVDTPEMEAFLDKIGKALEGTIGRKPLYTIGSTDANIPLSLGIPAACITGAEGGATHTRGEWLRKASLAEGVELVLAVARAVL